MVNHKKGQVWNKDKNKLMLDFEKQTGKNAIYRGKVTGGFEYWLWQLEKKKTKKPRKPRQTTKLSMTNKEKIKKLKKKLAKLEDEYGDKPSERYDIGNEIKKIQLQLEKLQKSKKPPPPPKKKGKPITKKMKIQAILKKKNPIAVGVVIEVEDTIYFKPGRIGAPYKVTEKKLSHGIPMIQLRNLNTGRLSEKLIPEFDYLKTLKYIDKGGKEYKKQVKTPEAKTWNTLSQKRRFLFLSDWGYNTETKNKFVKLDFKQLPLYVQRQMAFQSNGMSIDNIANMKTDITNKRYEIIKDIESREKDNYYCLQCECYHYQAKGKLYKEHIKYAKPGSKKPLIKTYSADIQLKDLDIRLRKLVREYINGINYYYVRKEIKRDFNVPKEYKPAYTITFHVKKQERDNWKKYSTMGWSWVPDEHKFMEY